MLPAVLLRIPAELVISADSTHVKEVVKGNGDLYAESDRLALWILQTQSAAVRTIFHTQEKAGFI